MEVSVVFYSHRRPSDLKRCLAALGKQAYPINMVIIITRSGDNEGDDIIASYESFLKIKKLIVPLSCGPMEYYNMALQMCAGDILAVTHDDAEPNEDWLSKIVLSYDHPKVGGVGGREIFPGYEHVQIATNNIGKVFWWGRISGNHHYLANKIMEVDFLTGSNCSYRISFLHEIGGFDTKLCWQRDSCWYWDLSVGLRLKRAGYSLLYNPKVVVNHFPGDLFSGKGGGYWKKVGVCKAKNETWTMLNYFYKNSLQKTIYMLWAFLIGTTDTYGLLQFFRYLPKERELAWKKFQDAIHGRFLGVVQ